MGGAVGDVETVDNISELATRLGELYQPGQSAGAGVWPP